MTDPKPATPATDEEIADTQARAHRVTGIGSVRALKLIARIAADAETIKAARQERDAVKEALVEAREIIASREAAYDQAQEGLKSARKQESEMRETIRKQAEEIERLRKVRTGSAVERLHNLCDGFEESDKAQEAELATLRAQVETLREAVKTLLASAHPHPVEHPTMTKAWALGKSTLAATEPKGEAR